MKNPPLFTSNSDLAEKYGRRRRERKRDEHTHPHESNSNFTALWRKEREMTGNEGAFEVEKMKKNEGRG